MGGGLLLLLLPLSLTLSLGFSSCLIAAGSLVFLGRALLPRVDMLAAIKLCAKVSNLIRMSCQLDAVAENSERDAHEGLWKFEIKR